MYAISIWHKLFIQIKVDLLDNYEYVCLSNIHLILCYLIFILPLTPIVTALCETASTAFSPGGTLAANSRAK